MEVDQGARGPFEVHIGFPEGYDHLFHHLLGSGPRWKPTQFDHVWRNLSVTRYDAHDVPGGVRHLATHLSPTYEDALSALRSAREEIGCERGVRAEIERVLRSPTDVYRRDMPTALEAPAAGLVQINDLPAWESHISFTCAHGETFSPSWIMDMPNNLRAQFNEIAFSNKDTKLIFTVFWDSLDLMFDTTPQLAERIQHTLPFELSFKLSMEQILICARFN